MAMQSTGKIMKFREAESNVPTIVMDLEVEGIDYTKLTTDANSAALKQSFADAVRKNIAALDGAVDEKSVALDIRNGGKINGQVPYIMLTAKFPSPAGLTSKETTAKWTTQSIAASMQTSLEGIA